MPQELVKHVNSEAKIDEPGEPAADKQPVREKTPLEYVQGFLNFFTERSKGNLGQVTVPEAAKAGGLDPSQWEIIRAIVGSGASVPVIHPATRRGYEVLGSAGSKGWNMKRQEATPWRTSARSDWPS